MTAVGRAAIVVAVLLSLAGRALAQSGPTVTDLAERADWAAVSALIDHGTDIHAAQVDGMTALHLAAYHDNPDVAGSVTTAQAMGDNLMARLVAAGIRFEVVE